MKPSLSVILMRAAIAGMLPSMLPAAEVSLHWLDREAPAVGTGLSFGVPWPEGAVQPNSAFALSSGGQPLPIQTWPLAYWPDGSLKWSGVATIAGPDVEGPVTIATTDRAGEASAAVRVTEAGDAIEIDTGALQARIPKQGPHLIEQFTIDGRAVARNGRLEGIFLSAPETDPLVVVPREHYVSTVKRVTVEQSGPVRAVVKIEGMHRSESSQREWLPFVVRLYFYAGEEPVRMVHTILYDGDKAKDFIQGLGITFDIPFREEPQNRHVRFSNSNGGLFAEPVLIPAFGWGPTRSGEGEGPVPNQLEGERLPATRSELARWDAFKLNQLSSNGFTIVKRTNPDSSWVSAAEGERASGLIFVGDVTGGLAVSVKDFWQSYPASLAVTGATTSEAQLQVWLWSPDGPVMDMRHYDTRGHGPVNGGSGSYEDYEEAGATPFGVARTSELTLFPSGSVPARAETVQQARAGSSPPLLVASPEHLHSVGAFGLWSVQDRSTPFRRQVEDRLEATLDFYRNAIDQHHWYGFWNYGDVMHGYDARRHQWRYDVGGYAWDNSELGSPLWLWYSFLRTGRADIFRMAEAMSRHNSEVDSYHFGPFAGMGSRHNVSHWGDSAKEARVSQATHNRFHFYLTTDERMGDILMEMATADVGASLLDPMRKAQPKTDVEKQYPGRIRIGPDWLAFAGNWMTAWERTGDKKWRDKIQAGVDSLAGMRFWMRSGRNLVVGYDPETSRLYQVNDQPGSYNLPTIQGGAEVAFELVELLDDPQWTRMWLQYCRLGTAPAEVLLRDQETGNEGADASYIGESGGANSQGTPRLAGYVYYKTKNPAYAERAMTALVEPRGLGGVMDIRRIEGAETLNPVDEAPGISTNDAAQSSLMAIELLEMLADFLPHDPPPPPAAPASQ